MYIGGWGVVGMQAASGRRAYVRVFSFTDNPFEPIYHSLQRFSKMFAKISQNVCKESF
jgi:hypothetical protein